MIENQKNLSTQEKIDLLTKDFLERDEKDNFVRIRRTGRLGWESTLPQDGAYSEYVLHPESKEDLIKNAYRIAGDMITVMNTPFKVNIAIVPDQSCTDAKTVWVATKVFDDPDLTVGKKLDTFIGLTVHEGCHLLYTDFEEGKKCPNDIVKSLQNIIEDERIEREIGESKPGLANFLKACKYYYFDKYREDMEKVGQTQGLDTFQRLMNTILSYIRYPLALKMPELQEFADVMLEVKDVLLPFPSSTAGSTNAAKRIYDLMKKYIKEDLKQQEERQRQQQQQPGGDQEGAGNQKPSGNGGDQQSGGGQGSQEQENDNQVQQDVQQQPMSDQEAEHKAQEQMNRSMGKIKGAMDNIASEPEKHGLDGKDQSETVQKDGGKVGKYIEGKLERGLKKGSYIQRGTENRDRYQESLDRVKSHIPAVSRILRCSSTEFKLSLKGMRSGVLDTGKLAEAYQGVPTVYTREGEVRTEKVAVCILIDESGSMWGQGEQGARDTAVLLNEALGGVPNVDLYIYGHTAKHETTDIFVYRERGFRMRYALGSTDSRAGNHDSIAIREACARVRKNTKEKCLFFMISDGAPNESTELVRKAVQDVEKQGFSVVAISIDPYYDPSTMYSRNVTLTDMNTLAVELGKLVKKAVIDNTKKTINL